MSEEERKKLGEEFIKLLNEMGVKNIKDIEYVNSPYKEDCREVWIVK